jgi:hypothetical protein
MIATRAPFDIRNPPTAMTLDLPPGIGPPDQQQHEVARRQRLHGAVQAWADLTPSIQLLDPRLRNSYWLETGPLGRSCPP